ncbi:unnamed protein product, partial [Owenia fusiformis]
KQIAKLNDRFMQLTADFLELQAQVTGLKTDNQKATLDIDELRHQKTTPVDQQKHQNFWNTLTHTGRNHEARPDSCNCHTEIQRLERKIQNVTMTMEKDIQSRHTIIHKIHKVENDMNKHNRHINRMERNMEHLEQKRGHQADMDPRQGSAMTDIRQQMQRLEDEIVYLKSAPPVTAPIPAAPLNAPQDAGPCPKDWVHYMSSCYKFENVTVNWPMAERHCRAIHPESTLLSVETQQENEFIIAYRDYNGAEWTSPWWWAGGTDMEREGSWMWIGTRKPITFHYWIKPGAGQREDEENSDCMYYTSNGDHRWDDWNCKSIKINFVCEIIL